MTQVCEAELPGQHRVDHRPPSRADTIIVMVDGAVVVEHGSRAELAAAGRYGTLWQAWNPAQQLILLSVAPEP
ncbi:MAG: hypothetical protein ACTH2Q_21400 [Propionibacteriaceae bacterium]